MTDTTSTAGLSGNVLFYGKPEPLSVEAHGTLGVDPVDKPYGFVAQTNLVPLTGGRCCKTHCCRRPTASGM